jgi:hypothetical protein
VRSQFALCGSVHSNLRPIPKAKIEFGLWMNTCSVIVPVFARTCKLRVTLDRMSYRGLSLKSKKYEASSCVSCRDFIEGLVYKKIGWVLLVVDKITVLANHRNLALVFFVLVD